MKLRKIYTCLIACVFAFLIILINSATLTAQTLSSFDTQTGTNQTVHPLTSVPAGALLVLVTTGELHSSANCGVSSNPVLTWTKRADAEAGNSGDAEIWTAVYTAGGSINVTSDWPGAANQASICYVITGQETTLGGASASANSQSAPNVNITTTRANSIIIGGISDWNAVNGSSRTYRDGSVTERLYHYISEKFTAYSFHRTATTVTTYTEGLSAPTGQSGGTVLYEVRGPDGGGGGDPDPPPACLTIASSNTATGGGSSVNSLTSVPAGALLVLVTTDELQNSANCAVSSIPALTWTKRADAEAGNSGNAEIWTAVYTAGGSINVTSNWPGSGNQASVCYAITGQETTLGGANASATSQSAPSVNITTTRANSIIIGGISDWNAVNGSSRAYRNSPTETFYNFVSGGFTSYHFYKSATTATTYTQGLTAPTGQSAGTVLYEIRCPAGGGAPDTIAPTAPVICFTGKTSTTLTIDDVTPASDNVAVTGYTAYYTGGSVNFSSFPYTITGLTTGNSYEVYVKAKDAATNLSSESNHVTRATLAANLLFDEGFENCNPWDNWSTFQDAQHAWSRQQSGDHANEGAHSFRAEVRSGCDGYVSSGFRSEVNPLNVQDTGTRWYGMSVYFETPQSGGLWPGSANGHFLQWHPSNGTGSATLALWGDDGKWQVMTNPSGGGSGTFQATKQGGGALDNITANTWHDLVFQVKWAKDGTGFVKFWLNGTLYFQSPTNLNFSGSYSGADGPYLKVGMNRWGSCSASGCASGNIAPCDTWVIYYDNVRIGNENADYNAVAPLTGTGFRMMSNKPDVTAASKPEKYLLGQSYPNPAKGQATIQVALPKKEKVMLSLYDVNGRLVKVLVNSAKEAGIYNINVNTGTLTKGVYYYKMQAGNFTDVKKLTVQ